MLLASLFTQSASARCLAIARIPARISACGNTPTSIISAVGPAYKERRRLGTEQKGVNGADFDGGGLARKDTPASSSLAASMQWRRNQIDKIESKFAPKESGEQDEGEDEGNGAVESDEADNDVVTSTSSNDDGTLPDIQSDDDLQPMWRDMESRVTRRRSLTAAQREPGKIGRRNVRKSDEDMWLESGLYDDGDDKGTI